MPRWDALLEPLSDQLRPDGTIGPVRFRAVGIRPFSIPPTTHGVSVPKPVSKQPRPLRVKVRRPGALPILGRLQLHLSYVERVDASNGGYVIEPLEARNWFLHEIERMARMRRRARSVGEGELVVPSTAPHAIASLVEHFGLRAISRALATVAENDGDTDPLRHPASTGPLSPNRDRMTEAVLPDGDLEAGERQLTARERAARRGFFVA
ncbi:MAG: hypothetical protein NTX54_01815 [Chloroflexi bacterium]|nr:hypothetical protein [Chloroflexota bacterium]